MINLQKVHLQFKIGANTPATPPLTLSQALQSVLVTHNDQGRSGFQLTFQIGRGKSDFMDYPILKGNLIKPFNRLQLTIVLNATVYPLMDGIITNHQFSPGDQSGISTLTVTGEDVSVMMDLEQKTQSHPNQSDDTIVRQLIQAYRQYNLIPAVSAPPRSEVPNTEERTPSQHSTDLTYIQTLAERHGYVFYITPGPELNTNTAYWGPRKRSETPQKALTVNMGPHTNITSINFQYNGMAPNKIAYQLNNESSQQIEQSTRTPALAKESAPLKRTVFFSGTRGLTAEQAADKAQVMVNTSMDEVVTANGELDTLHYGELLKPRGVVGLRGVGKSYDGNYYIKSITHKINLRNGEYKQSFSLAREGLVALNSSVNL